MEQEVEASTSYGSRDDLRQSGREYFQKMLTAKHSEAVPTKTARKRRENVDADVEAVGAAIEGSKLYVFLALCLACRAFGVLLLKVRSCMISNVRIGYFRM
jgi:hypothetical protein